MKLTTSFLTIAYLLASPLSAESLFNADNAGLSYTRTFTQAPLWESYNSGIGMDLNLGLASFILDIEHSPDISRVHADQPKIAKLGKDVVSRITLKSFSEDLREIWLNANFMNPNFTLASGRKDFNVLVKARVESCNDEPLPQVIALEAKLGDTVRSFRGFDFSQILHCTLKPSKITTNAVHLSTYKTHGNYGFQDQLSLNLHSKITIDGDAPTVTVHAVSRKPLPRVSQLQQYGPTSTTVTYRLSQESLDPQKADAGLKAGKKIARKLSEYTRQMIALYDESSAKKSAVRDAFFNPEIVEELKSSIKIMDEGIPHMKITDILTLNFSVNQAYAYAAYFEGKLYDQFNLDYLIRSRQ